MDRLLADEDQLSRSTFVDADIARWRKERQMKGAKYSIGKSGAKIVLAEYCDACKGQGRVAVGSETEPKEIPCGECDGFGATITEDGSQILALVNDILLKGRRP